MDADTRDAIEKAGTHLYGLLHARYILTSRGLQKMVRLPYVETDELERKIFEATIWPMSPSSV